MSLKSFLICFFGFLCSSVPISAQIIPSEEESSENSDPRIGAHYSLLPIAGYSSDWGFYGGGLVQRIDYGNNIRPFLSNLETNATFSTKGNIILDFDYEHTRSFGTDLRSRIKLFGQRIRQGHYFGIGNRTEYSSKMFDDNYFFYENREFFFEYEARKNVLEFGEYGILDLLGVTTISYVNGLTRGDESKYEEDMPVGFGKSWVNKLGVGLVADSRDSEFIPTRGFRYEAVFKTSPELLGSDHSYSQLGVDLRHYLELPAGVILAQKLQVESILGSAPFWDLAMIGSQNGLRGFHENRFRGDHSIQNIFELRTWLFSMFDDDIRFGGQLFWDTGRVYSGSDSNQLFDNWQHAFGAGGVVTLFTPDLMLRADIGFSNETYRIYFGAGYVF